MGHRQVESVSVFHMRSHSKAVSMCSKCPLVRPFNRVMKRWAYFSDKPFVMLKMRGVADCRKLEVSPGKLRFL